MLGLVGNKNSVTSTFIKIVKVYLQQIWLNSQ